MTTDKDNRPAGKLVIRIGNVSDPTLTVYAPKENNTGAAVVVFPGGGDRILAIDLEGGEDWTFRKETVEQSIKLQSRVKISATEGLRAAVFSDLGLAVASEWAFSPELKSGAVVAVMDDWKLPTIALSALYPTGRMASSKARQFAAFVEGCLASEFAPAILGDAINALAVLRFSGEQALIFELLQRRVDGSGARAIDSTRSLFEHLHQLVAVAGSILKQRQ